VCPARTASGSPYSASTAAPYRSTPPVHDQRLGRRSGNVENRFFVAAQIEQDFAPAQVSHPGGIIMRHRDDTLPPARLDRLWTAARCAGISNSTGYSGSSASRTRSIPCVIPQISQERLAQNPAPRRIAVGLRTVATRSPEGMSHSVRSCPLLPRSGRAVARKSHPLHLVDQPRDHPR